MMQPTKGNTLKTLAQILLETNDHCETRTTDKVVYVQSGKAHLYFGLRDYVVSSVSGPVLWLIPR